MNQHHNEGRGSGKGKKSGRGSVKNAARLEAFVEQRGRGRADWGGCNADKLLAVVVNITMLGGALTLGLSRDEGAHSLTLLLDGNRKTLWFNGDADLDAELDEVLAILASMS